MLHTTFCDFFAYFGQNLFAVATSLKPLQSEMSYLDWSTPISPVISNCILVVSRRNAFICTYSNFSPKFGCHCNAPLSLVYGSVTYEFPDSTDPISKANSAWLCRLQLKLWPFLWYFAYFGQNLVAMAKSLRPLQKGKGKGFPILDTERWARSWSRCTGSQPAGDRRSSTWR